jgi:hypothetical protein
VRNKLSFVNKLSENANTVRPTPATPAASSSAAIAPAAPAAPAAALSPPPVAAAPAAPAATSEIGGDDVDAATAGAVKETLSAWASAWSAQNVDEYLATYATAFRPEGGISRATWEAQRRDRVTRPKHIRVGVVKPQMSALGDGRVRVIFRQEYESDSFSDNVTKVLELRDEGGWKILREYTR